MIIKAVRKDLTDFIERKIVPIYDNHDGGHNKEHMYEVIDRTSRYFTELVDIMYPNDILSMKLDINIAIAAAACHDVGLIQGRENHEEASCMWILNDEDLKKLFDTGDSEYDYMTIMFIAMAAKEHRASYKGPMTSIYSSIVAAADRNMSVSRFIGRAWAYNSEAFPDENYDQILKRVMDFGKYKFGKDGYAWNNLPLKLPSIINSMVDFKMIVETDHLFETMIRNMMIQ